MKISHRAGSFSEQSANFPGSAILSKAPLRLARSRAFLAASLALQALMPFSNIALATPGFSSRNSANFSLTACSTMPLVSEFPNFVLVCPSNCGSGTFILIIADKPSLKSSPDGVTDIFFNKSFSVAYAFKVRVKAALKPDKCVPPSSVWILFTYESNVS